MRISEIFYSLQGEGFLAGTPSVFVRLAGCPLHCRWCDTKYACKQTAGRNYSIPEVIKAIKQWDCEFIVITGGEPMINPELPKLTQQLKTYNKHITIETAGIAFLTNIQCDLMSISPKLANSTPAEPHLASIHESSRLNIPVLRKLLDNYKYELKFVVDSPDDLSEIKQIIEKLGNVDPKRVMLMPQAAVRDELLAKSPMVAELCKRANLAFCQRLQVLLWNNKPGT